MKTNSTFDLPARSNSGSAPERGNTTVSWLQLIREAVEAVEYGTIQIKVHAGEVVQIETTRKIRVPSKTSSSQPTASVEAPSVQ